MIYTTHTFLRLCRRSSVLQSKRYNHIQTTNGPECKRDNEKVHQNKPFNVLLEENKDKIVFNSHLQHEQLELGNFKYFLKQKKDAIKQEKRIMYEKTLSPLPVALQYCVDKDMLLKEEKTTEDIVRPEGTFQLPLAQTTPVEINQDEITQTKFKQSNSEKLEYSRNNLDKWMTNYDNFDDTSLLSDEDSDGEEVSYQWTKYYGTPDPSVEISRVACGGCGALLHCTDPAIPGYLPSEIFTNTKEEELKTTECQRCHFLKEYNIALDVSVQPEEYEKLLQSIRYVKSLVLLMVDLLDFPCSVWPGIVDIIGTDRPLIIVGNKVDLLPGDSVGYLKRVKESLMTEICKTKLSEANIKHVAIISAKTGYGVEDLISNMFKIWLAKGDVFLVGCTNVGKSSLFNALLQSDYCKVHAVDIVKRATVSRWPGTTLNLLKFPINRPSGWKIYMRTRRLKEVSRLMKVEKEIRAAQLSGRAPTETPTLMGHIGRTFSDPRNFDDAFVGREARRDEPFERSKWFYDTPGVVHPDQALSLLTTEELLLALPRQVIRPQTYYLHKGYTLFIGGLARLDHVDCAAPCRFTVFSSAALPITVTRTEHADEVYDKFVGSELFAAPTGGAERLRNWPGLQTSGGVLEFEGEGPKVCCGDVVLSSVGWVSVTAKRGTTCRVTAWTPAGRGVRRRAPALLPYAVNLKGKRLRDTPAYMVGHVYSDDE